MGQGDFFLLIARNFWRAPLAALLLFTIACERTLEVGDLSNNFVTGQIVRTNFVADLGCVSPKVSIYRTDATGIKTGSALAQTDVLSDGSYKLKISSSVKSEMNAGSAILPFMLELGNCTTSYRRYVTGAETQDISAMSNLTSFLAGSITLATTSRAGFNSLLTSLVTHNSEEDAYDDMDNTALLSSSFQTVFGVPHTDLMDLAPNVVTTSVPSTGTEDVSLSLATTTQHWHSAYNTAWEWKEVWTEYSATQERLLAQTMSSPWIPSRNSQGSRSVVLVVGQDDGGNLVDTTKPYRTMTFPITIADATPVSMPSVTFTGTVSGGVGYVSTTAVALSLSTGALNPDGIYNNCRNFSDLGIVEVNNSSPAAGDNLPPSSWNIQCNTVTTQAINYTLTSGTGSKTIKIWARDSAGNIVATPTAINIYYSNSTPAVAFSTPAASAIVSASAMTVTGTCDSFAGNVGLSGPLDDGLGNNTMSVACTSGAWTAGFTLTGADGSKTITASQTNALSQTGSATRAFIKDGSAPLLTNTNTTGAINATGVTLVGACETGISVVIAGAGVTGTTGTCTASAYSIPVTFASSDGAKAISITQTDSVANSTVVNISYTVDTDAPDIAFTSPASMANVQGSITAQGTCETGLTVTFAGDVSSGSTTSCTAGNFSATVTFSAGEGSKTITASQTDAAGNATTDSRTFTKDSIAPSLAALSPLENTPHQTGATITGTCEAGLSVVVTGDVTGTSGLCGAGTFSIAVAFTSGDASKTVTFTQTDASANATSINWVLVKDTTPPNLTQTAITHNSAASAPVTFSGACETGRTITITGAETTTATCTASAWSFLTTQSVDGVYAYTFAQTDVAGNTTTINTTWRLDTSAPTITAGTFFLNESTTPGTVGNVNLSVEFDAEDTGSALTSFCMLYNTTTKPLWNDPCWINFTTLGLSAGNNISVTLAQNYYFQTGYAVGDYDIYVWVKNAAGLVSDLTSAGAGTIGTDYIEVHYDPGEPPTISSFVALSVDLPSNPPTAPELQAALGSSVYFRWRITDDNAIAAGSIKLSFFNPVSGLWEPIAAAQSLNNSANGGCTADDPLTALTETGCYVWSSGSPSNSPYQVRVQVVDTNNQTEQTSSAPINTGNMRVIAGNTDPGLNGSARTATVFPYAYSEDNFPGQFVVTPNGYVFIWDSRGLMRIKPSDGTLKMFLPKTGANSAFGLLASQTTVQQMSAIALDQDGLVLLRVSGGILRFDPKVEDPVINRVIGGGVSTSGGVLASQFLIDNNLTSRETLFATPSGRIYFSMYDNFFYYDENTGMVEQVVHSGTGAYGRPAANIGGCKLENYGVEFDQNTSVITTVFATVADWGTCISTSASASLVGLNPLTFESLGDIPPPINMVAPVWSHQTSYRTGVNGSLYAFSFNQGHMFKYDKTSNTFQHYFSGLGQGYCVDGTLKSSCSVVPQDIFVDKFGKVYFLEGGRIRVIQADNTLLTLYGSSRMAGDGGTALAARMVDVNSFDKADDGMFFIMQNTSHVIRRFVEGGNIARHAGTGNTGAFNAGEVAVNTPLTGLGNWSTAKSFALNPGNKDIYLANNDNTIFKLPYTGTYGSRIIGGGATGIHSADGMVGTDIGGLTWINTKPLGFFGDHLVVSTMVDGGVVLGAQWRVKAYDSTDSFRQLHLMGNDEYAWSTVTPCSTGLATNACFFNTDSLNRASASYDSISGSFFLDLANGIYASRTDNTIEDLGAYSWIRSQTYRRVTGAPDQEYIYWCSGDGSIYKKNVTAGTSATLFTPVLGINCAGQSLNWDDANKKLSFPFIQNSLWGIAEIYDP